MANLSVFRHRQEFIRRHQRKGLFRSTCFLECMVAIALRRREWIAAAKDSHSRMPLGLTSLRFAQRITLFEGACPGIEETSCAVWCRWRAERRMPRVLCPRSGSSRDGCRIGHPKAECCWSSRPDGSLREVLRLLAYRPGITLQALRSLTDPTKSGDLVRERFRSDYCLACLRKKPSIRTPPTSSGMPAGSGIGAGTRTFTNRVVFPGSPKYTVACRFTIL